MTKLAAPENECPVPEINKKNFWSFYMIESDAAVHLDGDLVLS
jgi:hypothetical protein